MLPFDISSPDIQARIREIFARHRFLKGLSNQEIADNWPTQTKPNATNVAGWITGSKGRKYDGPGVMSDQTIGRLRIALGIDEKEFWNELTGQSPVEVELRKSVDEIATQFSDEVMRKLQRLDNVKDEITEKLKEAQHAVNDGRGGDAKTLLDAARTLREDRRETLDAEVSANDQQHLLELKIDAQVLLSKRKYHETIEVLSEAMRLSVDLDVPDMEDLSTWRTKVICLNAMCYGYDKAVRYL